MTTIMTILVGVCITALILVIWFRTDAWLEYTRIFRLNFLSLYKEYDNRKHNDLTLTYHHFLRLHHDGFIVRLITCPTCVAVWLAILSSAGVYCLGVYSLFLAAFLCPVFAVLGLLLFLVIERLLG